MTAMDLEKQRIQEIAQEYQAKRYDVTVQPEPSQLPDFLTDYRPDILARREEETVVIEIKSRISLAKSQYLPRLAQAIEERSGWRFELVVINPKDNALSLEDARSLEEGDIAHTIKEIKEILKPHHPEAALLLAWSTTESTLRLLANKEEIPLQRRDPPYLLKQLAIYAAISRDEYNTFMRAMRLRNAIAHGFKATGFQPVFVKELAEMTYQLLQSIPDAGSA
jgi:hypothetical protein